MPEKLSKKACAKYITVIFDGDIEYVKRYLNIQSAEIMLLNEGELISGYCHIIGCSPVKGKNVQIYHKNGRIYIGCPSIFGSY